MQKLPLSFTQKVYDIAAKIPLGKVATYGQIAILAGSPRAARAVGMAMRTNKDTTRIPCHRVVASNGALTGYAFGNGIPQKEKMLRAEGVVFNGTKIDLAASQWHKPTH
jgi:methylated-DNA-protein-cysteine methyltransferase-like protein